MVTQVVFVYLGIQYIVFFSTVTDRLIASLPRRARERKLVIAVIMFSTARITLRVRVNIVRFY